MTQYEAAAQRGHRGPWWIAAFAIGAGLGIWAANYALVQRPIAQIHRADPRNADFTISAHYGYYVDPRTLVLDLVGDAGRASPADLLRGTFQAADAMQHEERAFTVVVFARNGRAVFEMNGGDFHTLGREYAQNQNPLFLSRTLPEKLRRPDGTAAFGAWTGGLLDVVGKQMEDVNNMAVQWVAGGDLTRL